MVAQLDHAIGRVLDTLDERGLADDTLVMITTDHGEFLGEHQMIFKGPLGYDSLLRVPLLVRGPNVPAGIVVDDPVGTIDLAPTMLAAAGIDEPEWIEGRRLLDGPREWVLTENDFTSWRGCRCVRSRPSGTSCTATSSIRSASCTTSGKTRASS